MRSVTFQATEAACPFCGAQPGLPCKSEPDGPPLSLPHGDRVAAARRVGLFRSIAENPSPLNESEPS
jgi:hypothetical protein